jgi:hypothetical protein
MSTNAQLAAKLLRDASSFFRNVGEQNPQLSEQMENNAEVYEQVAGMVEADPNAELPVQQDNAPNQP